MRVSAIIEARMGSKRLPGKMMMKVGHVPLIAWPLQRCYLSQLVDTLVVACPDTPLDRALSEWVSGNTPAKVVLGSEDDVMSRVLKAARKTKTDVIVEITGDCPLIDPEIIDMAAGYYICGDWDFVGNVSPETWPQGMSVRVFSTEALARANEEVKGDPQEAHWREHVSPWFYRQDTPYKCLNLTAPDDCTAPQLNLSVDTREDLQRARGVIEALATGNPGFNVKEVLQYLMALPGYEQLADPVIWKESNLWQPS